MSENSSRSAAVRHGFRLTDDYRLFLGIRPFVQRSQPAVGIECSENIFAGHFGDIPVAEQGRFSCMGPSRSDRKHQAPTRFDGSKNIGIPMNGNRFAENPDNRVSMGEENANQLGFERRMESADDYFSAIVSANGFCPLAAMGESQWGNAARSEKSDRMLLQQRQVSDVVDEVHKKSVGYSCFLPPLQGLRCPIRKIATRTAHAEPYTTLYVRHHIHVQWTSSYTFSSGFTNVRSFGMEEERK